MKRKNRLIILENDLKNYDREELLKSLDELKKRANELKERKEEIEKPFMKKIEELKKEIEKIKREMRMAVENTENQIGKLIQKANEIKKKLMERENILNEKSYLEFLEKVKKFVENGWIIYEVDVEPYPYQHEIYKLGETIGISSNWNTPSKITDIKLSEKTFRIKSEIAKDYRSISLGGEKFPVSCHVVLTTGIKPEKASIFDNTITCPKCSKKAKVIAPEGMKETIIARPKKKCPICGNAYYYVCERCGNVYHEEPQCEHKDIVKESIQTKSLSWESQHSDFKLVESVLREMEAY